MNSKKSEEIAQAMVAVTVGVFLVVILLIIVLDKTR